MIEALFDLLGTFRVLLFRLGHGQQAIDALQAALSARPDFPLAQRALARIAKLSGGDGPRPDRPQHGQRRLPTDADAASTESG